MSEELRRGIPKAIVIGKHKITDEEYKIYDPLMESDMRKRGMLKDDEYIHRGKKCKRKYK